MNAVVVRNPLQGQEEMRRNSYIMDIDKEKNCYNCRRFGHFVRNYRNWDIVSQERRIEYGDTLNIMNYLKEKKNLVVLN